MKKLLIALALMTGVTASIPAWAETPVLTQPQFTTTIKCTKAAPVDANTGLAKVSCEPADLEKYPFLAGLTKEPTQPGSIFQFDIARVEGKGATQPVLIVNMYNETIYTSPWGSTGTFVVNTDGSYTGQWIVNGGTVSYTAACPNQLSYIIKGNEKSTYGEWVYDGKNVVRIAGHEKLDALPACK
jgi:hypothetical protein